MSKPAVDRAPLRLIVGALVLAVLTGAGVFLVLPLLARPIVEGNAPTSFIGVDSDQTGGTLWMTVNTMKPIEIDGDDSIELQIEVASDVDGTHPRLILGGEAATAVGPCAGEGMYVDDSTGTVAYAALDVADQNDVMQYERRAPSTGVLYDYFGSDTRSVDSALERAKSIPYRSIAITSSASGTRTWTYSGEPNRDYPVKIATLTCSFKRSAFLRTAGYTTGFAAPDLFASVGELSNAGPIRVDYNFDFLNNPVYSRPVMTFTSVSDHVDPQSGLRLLSVSGDYWIRNMSGTTGVLISSGTAQFEPESAATWRVWARLLAAFLAAMAVALAIISIRKGLYYFT